MANGNTQGRNLAIDMLRALTMTRLNSRARSNSTMFHSDTSLM